MKKRILVLLVGLMAAISFNACGGGGKKVPPSGLHQRVLASQGVTDAVTSGGLYIIDAWHDVIPRLAPIAAGNSPGLMAVTPGRNVAAAFDSSSNAVYAVDTATEADIGNLRIPGPTWSMVFPTALATGYAAVPNAVIDGFTFTGAVAVLNFATQSSSLIAVSGAQTVVSNSTGSQLFVFSNNSDSMTILNPGLAAPPVDTSCYANTANGVCTIIPGFSRPVYAVLNGGTAYVLSCGLQCGGSQQASVAVFDIASLTITGTIPVDAATWALLSGSTLYVAGTSPTNDACTGEQTAAKTCGRLDVVDLSSGTVTGTAVITDGYHDRMDLTQNGQLFIGSYDCTNIGDVDNPNGEVRGCLSIYHVADGSVVIPANNGNVNGLQGFTSRYVEYVAEGGALYVYDTLTDELLINDFVPQGTLNIPGYIGDVKAIDNF